VARTRQTVNIKDISVNNPKNLTPRQETEEIRIAKNETPELKGVPTTSFVPHTKGLGIFGSGLLAPRPNIAQAYIESVVSPQNKPIISKPRKYTLFFIKYNNQNLYKGLEAILKSFSVVKTLSPVTIKDCSEMLRIPATDIVAIDQNTYDTGSFTHPKYINDSNQPLSIRYAEIAILKQKTPGRLDNIPLGYPDFDSTPDGITTRIGPIPTPPYTNFAWATGPAEYVSAAGATSSGSTINVKTTTGLTAGMYIAITTQGIGSLASNTKVVSVVNTKQFTVTPSPTTQLTGNKNVVSGNLPATIIPGGSVKFLDTSVRSPWQFAPTGWNWVFGPSASPTGSTGQNPTVTYGATGIYTVTLTASNAAGSTPKTKTNFVIVTY
jgi:PKD repeat protein